MKNFKMKKIVENTILRLVVIALSLAIFIPTANVCQIGIKLSRISSRVATVTELSAGSPNGSEAINEAFEAAKEERNEIINSSKTGNFIATASNPVQITVVVLSAVLAVVSFCIAILLTLIGGVDIANYTVKRNRMRKKAKAA